MSDYHLVHPVEHTHKRGVSPDLHKHGIFLPTSYFPASHEAPVLTAQPLRRKQGILLPKSYFSTAREITAITTIHSPCLPKQPGRTHTKIPSSIILPESEPLQPLNVMLLTQLAAIVLLFLVAVGIDVELFIDNPVRILSIAIVLLILFSTLLLFRLKHHYKVAVLTNHDLLDTTISLRAVTPVRSKQTSEVVQNKPARFHVLQNSTSMYLQAIKTNITERGDR